MSPRTEVVTWPEVEAALQARPGWRRAGNEWRGPCEVGGGGTDTAWWKRGDNGEPVGGCHRCGGPFGRAGTEAFKAHLYAVTGGPDRPPFPKSAAPTRSRAPRGDFSPSPGPNVPDSAEALSEAVWRAGVPADRTPGRRYLVERRRVWPDRERLPDSVRWLPADLAGALRPKLPKGAAGAILYGFSDLDRARASRAGVGTGRKSADPLGSSDFRGFLDTVSALQVEAVRADGERVLGWRYWDRDRRAEVVRETKRPSVTGARFAGGARVFVARRGTVTASRVTNRPGNRPGAAEPDRGPHGVHLCEGPLDALALVALERLGVVRLGGAAVVGTNGTAGFKPAACIGSGPVTVWPDLKPTRDGTVPGAVAAGRLVEKLTGSGRRVEVRWDEVPKGGDVADWAKQEAEPESDTA